jgi:hypothetical protein
MRLYVNGDSHTAAAEAVNPHAFAQDDSALWSMGRVPHPDNLAVSWGKVLADKMDAEFTCDAESAASNTRIIRTTKQWLTDNPKAYQDTLMIIQWSTWERQEWLVNGVYYQVNASGTDSVPGYLQETYKRYISEINWLEVMEQAHRNIWDFRQSLNLLGVRHIFFNGNNSFFGLPPVTRKNWGTNYIHPYDQQSTYNQWLRNNGFTTVNPDSWHFGEAAHSTWADYMLQYIIDNKLL